ncbi:uncharacterized protein LOC116256477 [Nymphaea colorata]|nr:uncharacterized protein LOC116256477 [Nymphaea colorata]
MSNQRQVEGYELEEQMRLSCSPALSSPHHSGDPPPAAALTAAFTPLYYVQSPHSSLSHAHTHTTQQADQTPLLSPITSTFTASAATAMIVSTNHRHHAINDSNSFSIALPPDQSARSNLSRYSSSRGSSSSFLRAKTNYVFSKLENGLRNVGGGDNGGHGGGGDDDDLDTSAHCVYLVVKIAWKALVSFLAAIFVFLLLTRQPIPQLNVKDVMIREFRLAEGVDKSGVPTKMLRFNCSVDLEIDNKSRVFGVHLHKATLQLAFQSLTLAISHGEEMYVERNTVLSFRLFIGGKEKAMYAAGEAMDARLESGMGLPLELRLSMKSHVAHLWGIVRPSGFTHHTHCTLLFLDRKDHVFLRPKQDRNVTCTTRSR